MARVTTTDGGSHPPEKMAIVLAEEIAPFDFNAETARGHGIAAQKFQTAFAEGLTPIFEAAQKQVLAELATDADAHFAADHGEAMLKPYCEQTVALVQRLSAGTPWAAHFADPDRLRTIYLEAGRHFATAHDIERQWHHVNDPSHEAARAYYVMRHGAPHPGMPKRS